MFSESDFVSEIMEFCRADSAFQVEIENLYHASCYYLYTLTGKILEGSTLENNTIFEKEQKFFKDYEIELAKLYIKVMCCNIFEDKSLTCEKASKKNYIYDSILNQLRYND